MSLGAACLRSRRQPRPCSAALRQRGEDDRVPRPARAAVRRCLATVQARRPHATAASGSVQADLDREQGNVTVSVQCHRPRAPRRWRPARPATVTFVKLPAGAAGSAAARAPERRAQPRQRPGLRRHAQRCAQPGSGGGSAARVPAARAVLRRRPAGRRVRGGKTATATVTAVQAGRTASATATIAIAKLPGGVTAKYTGFAQITGEGAGQQRAHRAHRRHQGQRQQRHRPAARGRQDPTQSVMVGQQTAGRGRDHLGPERRPEHHLHAHLHGPLPRRARGGGFPGGGQGLPAVRR